MATTITENMTKENMVIDMEPSMVGGIGMKDKEEGEGGTRGIGTHRTGMDPLLAAGIKTITVLREWRKKDRNQEAYPSKNIPMIFHSNSNNNTKNPKNYPNQKKKKNKNTAKNPEAILNKRKKTKRKKTKKLKNTTTPKKNNSTKKTSTSKKKNITAKNLHEKIANNNHHNKNKIIAIIITMKQKKINQKNQTSFMQKSPKKSHDNTLRTNNN